MIAVPDGVIASSRLLQVKMFSEAQLQSFHDDYGPLARLAYAHAGNIPLYAQHLRHALKGLSLGTAVVAASSLDLSTPISHKLAIISPGEKRNLHVISLPSIRIIQVFRDKFKKEFDNVAAPLYELFLETPCTRSSAGYILTEHSHDIFCEGRTFELTPMKPEQPSAEDTTWGAPQDESPPHYLHIGVRR